MKLGQTSLIYFLSKFGSSILGFVATIYIARIIGADGYGIYSLALAVLAWMAIAGKIGLSSAIIKRVSETDDPGAYVTSGALMIAVVFLVTSAVALVLRGPIENYVGEPLVAFILVLLLAKLCWSLVTAVLQGEQKVHVYAALAPVQTGIRSALQIAAVALGFGVAGLLGAYAVGAVVVALVGATYASVSLARPTLDHVRSLYDYAKFAWLGNLKKQSFSWVDVTVLGFFVIEDLVGVYAIAWSIAAVLTIFSKGISTTLFPEMSNISANQDPESVANLVTDAVRYNGLVLIPGLVGALVVGERVLLLYGEEFVIGTAVLALLVAARMLYAYQNQLVNTINGIDRPDIAFRINAVFIGVNTVLNIVLIWQYGWIGAAVATLCAAAVSLVHARVAIRNFLTFRMPLRDIGKQCVAAVLMGGVVLALTTVVPPARDALTSHLVTVALVTFGAGVYFLTYLAISTTFRDTVRRNLPVDVPGL